MSLFREGAAGAGEDRITLTWDFIDRRPYDRADSLCSGATSRDHKPCGLTPLSMDMNLSGLIIQAIGYDRSMKVRRTPLVLVSVLIVSLATDCPPKRTTEVQQFVRFRRCPHRSPISSISPARPPPPFPASCTFWGHHRNHPRLLFPESSVSPEESSVTRSRMARFLTRTAAAVGVEASGGADPPFGDLDDLDEDGRLAVNRLWASRHHPGRRFGNLRPSGPGAPPPDGPLPLPYSRSRPRSNPILHRPRRDPSSAVDNEELAETVMVFWDRNENGVHDSPAELSAEITVIWDD